MSSPDRTYAHVDMDAFFASVEIHDRPELRGLPVVVSNNRSRSVVAAASYASRRFGVRSAMPLAEAKRLCADLVVVPARMDRYREVSGAVMEILSHYSQAVEIAGLDEAYIDLSDSPMPKSRARALKTDVKFATGLTCSIGIGPNKLIAKIASDREKPDGLCRLTVEDFRAAVADSPVRLIPGIGPKTAAKLEQAGLAKVSDLATCERDRMRELLGPAAVDLIDRARGIDGRRLETERVRKSESRETTFETDVADLERLERVLAELAREVLAGLSRKGLTGRTVTLKLRFAPFETRTRSRTFDAPVTTEADLIAIGAALLRPAVHDAPPVRLLGIGLSTLETATATPGPHPALF